MTVTTETCWADPLTRKERRALSGKLARACQRFYNTPAGTAGAMHSQIVASAEMSDLHMDVTERAAVPPAEPMPPLTASLYVTADLMDSAGKANR